VKGLIGERTSRRKDFSVEGLLDDDDDDDDDDDVFFSTIVRYIYVNSYKPILQRKSKSPTGIDI